MRNWTQREIERLVDWTLDGLGLNELATRLRMGKSTVRAMQVELELIDGARIRRRWTASETALLRELYTFTPTDQIANRLGRPLASVHQHAAALGLKKSKETIAAVARAKLLSGDHGSIRYRYPKGHAPANKGSRRPGYAPGRMAETQFKRGESRNKMPLGSTRLIDGYLYRKTSEIPNVPYSRNWTPEHYLLWEKEHGAVPSGHALVFKDGNRGNVQLDNLELITRAELARRNTIHKLPEDLKQVIRLNASIKRRIRKLHAKKQDDGSAGPSVRDTRAA